MEALVTDVEVAVDFILLAIHEAVEQEVCHCIIGSATELKWSDPAVDGIDRQIGTPFVSICL